jgi:uncharacterized protein (TIGR02466 family)
MQIVKLFPTTIALIDASSVLESAENFFNKSGIEINQTDQTNTNLGTSLAKWRVGSVTKTAYVEDDDSKVLKDFILEHAKEYLEYAGYDITNVILEVASVWANKMESEASHGDHNHVGCLMSGCMYLEMPKNGGEIKFSNPAVRFDRTLLDKKEFTEFNSDTWSIAPKRGDLLMWASHVVHGVKASTFEGVRRSLAFDVVITGIK